MIDRRARVIACLALVASVLVSACGGSNGTPTSPSTPVAAGTKIISISGTLAFGDVTLGSTKELTITVSNTGTATLSFTGITASGGLTTHSAASPTSGSVPAGGSLPVLFRFTPASAGAFSGTVTFTADHTSGTNIISMSGTGVAAPTPPITLVGVVLDSATRRALSGVRVSALTPSLLTTIATTTTDGNGFYSIVVPSATAMTVSYTLNGYNIQNVSSTFSADARRDIDLGC